LEDKTGVTLDERLCEDGSGVVGGEKDRSSDSGIADHAAAARHAAEFADLIARGANPADLPIEQPIRFKLRINLKTAKALGITFPPTFLATADEVIE